MWRILMSLFDWRRVATWLLPSADQPRTHLADNTAAKPNGNLQEDLKVKVLLEKQVWKMLI
jgi:hypothetical protein